MLDDSNTYLSKRLRIRQAVRHQGFDSAAYTCKTTITAGTLALGSAGTINSSTNIAIAAGATFDVSAIASYTMSASTTLSASGTSVAPAVIKGGASGTVSSGSQPSTHVHRWNFRRPLKSAAHHFAGHPGAQRQHDHGGKPQYLGRRRLYVDQRSLFDDHRFGQSDSVVQRRRRHPCGYGGGSHD